tara:strand:+ start:12634 stop:13323 length:690 start_codon:yes stop_codon:yes gene_type:complete
MTVKIGKPEETNQQVKKIINLVKIKEDFLNNSNDFREFILKSINKNSVVLDVGKSMRNKYEKIHVKNKNTLDLNKFEDYPDFQLDLSDSSLEIDKTELNKKYDEIICLAVLEHVYNPFVALDNLKKMLKPDGIIYGYVPFLYFYHAPKNLMFQDFYRYSKDGLAYLFKDFNELNIYPVRGRLPTSFHILMGSFWKKFLEKKIINNFLNNLISKSSNYNQSSGYYFIAKK